MKKMFIALSMVLSLVFCSCLSGGICSPIIAYVEVLNSDNNSVADVVFTVALDGKSLDDVECLFTEYNDEDFEDACEGGDHVLGFTIGKAFYNVSSSTYGDIITAGNDNLTETVDGTLSRISITASKTGYKPTTFTPTTSNGNYISRASITLEKLSE